MMFRLLTATATIAVVALQLPFCLCDPHHHPLHKGVRPTPEMRVAVPANSNVTHLHFPEALLQKTGWGSGPSVPDQWTTYPTWNPGLATNKWMVDLCTYNRMANYPNPEDCTQIINCIGSLDYVYVSTCPAGDIYVPPSDICGYPENNLECPIKSCWLPDAPAPTCKNIGQRPWEPVLTLPREPEVMCSNKITYCNDYENEGDSECPPGTGYSKACFACLPYAACFATEQWYTMPY